ncbi:IS3 family transposase [Streptosporangium canum]|uniref:IS3 family transposase n=1 Tax=Streptosporangium canum TaxID=324952 RepID=UPI00379393F6
MAESFFSAIKNEWLHRFVFTIRAKAKRQFIRYIEGFCNHRRPHSATGRPSTCATNPFQPEQPHRLRP